MGNCSQPREYKLRVTGCSKEIAWTQESGVISIDTRNHVQILTRLGIKHKIDIGSIDIKVGTSVTEVELIGPTRHGLPPAK